MRLLDARPHIVHFAGHGSEDGLLLFEDADGLSAPVDIGRLAPADRRGGPRPGRDPYLVLFR